MKFLLDMQVLNEGKYEVINSRMVECEGKTLMQNLAYAERVALEWYRREAPKMKVRRSYRVTITTKAIPNFGERFVID